MGLSRQRRLKWVRTRVKAIFYGDVEKILQGLNEEFDTNPNKRLKRLIGYIERFYNALNYDSFQCRILGTEYWNIGDVVVRVDYIHFQNRLFIDRLILDKGWEIGTEVERFRVEKLPTNSHQRDAFFNVFIKPFHPMGDDGYFERKAEGWSDKIN